MSGKQVALLTGAYKGIGFETARRLGALGYTVLIGARDGAKADEAAGRLRGEGVEAHGVRLDVDSAADIVRVADEVERRFGRLDVLVNNAGVFTDHNTPVTELDPGTLSRTVHTNAVAPLLLIQAFLPLMKRNGYGRIVNVSSTLGAISDMTDPASPLAGMRGPSYRLSKLMLNGITALAARELKGTNILVNACCPGWVKTDMGGPNAPLTVEQGAETPVWLATLPDGGPSGGFFRNRQPAAW